MKSLEYRDVAEKNLSNLQYSSFIELYRFMFHLDVPCL